MTYPKTPIPTLKFDWLLLLLWLGIGVGLRLTNLASKSPWTDEFSTMVFSLGNSFRGVPLDQAIALDQLLQPLQPNPQASVTDVVRQLLSESNHPPVYFVLAHWWIGLFSLDGDKLLWVARSLPALLGAVSIPAIFCLSCWVFRSRLVGHLTAAMMTVSPYGIFLAQEARHYTLAILWVIASLACLMEAVRHFPRGKPLPFWVGLSWVIINSLGIATHYFFALTLCAEAIVLMAFWIFNIRFSLERKSQIIILKSLMFAVVGTLLGGLVWIPFWHSHDSQLTEWIKNSDRIGWEWVSPIFQAFAAWVTMLSLLPIEVSALPVVIASGLGISIFLIWLVPILRRGLKVQMEPWQNRTSIQTLGGFVLSAIALFFIITYGLGIDLTRGARYNFIYFPAVMVLVGASLAVSWNTDENLTCSIRLFLKREGKSLPHRKVWLSKGKRAVIVIWLMGLASAITVVFNGGYQKYYRPDLLVDLIQKNSQSPLLIATTHKTHVQTGELMGVAWEFRHLPISDAAKTPQFLLAHQEDKDSKNATITLQQTLKKLPRPLNLWLLNFQAPVELKAQNCLIQTQSLPPVDGYDYQIYHCP